MYKDENESLFFGENNMRYLLQFILPCSFAALVIICWTFLLSFPWDSAVIAMIYFQIGLVLLLLYIEYDASKVDGAAGWTFLVFCFFEMILFVALGIIRVIIGGWQVLNLLF